MTNRQSKLSHATWHFGDSTIMVLPLVLNASLDRACMTYRSPKRYMAVVERDREQGRVAFLPMAYSLQCPLTHPAQITTLASDLRPRYSALKQQQRRYFLKPYTRNYVVSSKVISRMPKRPFQIGALPPTARQRHQIKIRLKALRSTLAKIGRRDVLPAR